MCPSPPHPGRPGRPRRLSRFWIVLLVLALGVLALGGLGALLENQEKSASESTKPTAGPTTRAPTASSPSRQSPTEPPSLAGNSARAPTTDRPSSAPVGVPKGSAPVVVRRIVDGDTIVVRGDGRVVPRKASVRVRLLEIDTPERGTCYADAATDRTTALLPPGSTAHVVRDDELKDRYGRYLLYLWNDRGVFVNESLVRSGHAEAVLFPPNDKYWSKISRAQTAARRADAGLWSACPGTTKPPTTSHPPTSAPAHSGLPPGPPAGIPDVDCSDLSGPVWVGSDDPHRLDRDGDGIGCEAD
jgi:micrococcal nuclease